MVDMGDDGKIADVSEVAHSIGLDSQLGWARHNARPYLAKNARLYPNGCTTATPDQGVQSM